MTDVLALVSVFWGWLAHWSASLNHGPFMVLVFVLIWIAASVVASLARVLNRNASPRLALYLIDPLSKWVVFLFGITLYLFAVAWPQGHDLGLVIRNLGLSLDVSMDMVVLASAGLLLSWVAIASAFYAVAKGAGAKTHRNAHLLQPRSLAEKSAFLFVLSPTAGILEEIVFRGFLFLLFLQWQGDPWSAALSTSILFGLGHAYQGLGGILATGIMGWTAAATLIWTGSLWPAIIAHTIYDMATVIIYRRIPEPPPGLEDFNLARSERPFG